MKTIYFVQHGIAEPVDIDPQRPLSALGRSETAQVACHLSAHKIAIHKIYHSGKLRAQQTAEIFAAILKVSEVLPLSGMQPSDDPSELIGQLTEDAVIYIGHLPNIPLVVGKLVAAGMNNSVVKFKNSAVVCIELDINRASIKWFITPEMC